MDTNILVIFLLALLIGGGVVYLIVGKKKTPAPQVVQAPAPQANPVYIIKDDRPVYGPGWYGWGPHSGWRRPGWSYPIRPRLRPGPIPH